MYEFSIELLITRIPTSTFLFDVDLKENVEIPRKNIEIFFIRETFYLPVETRFRGSVLQSNYTQCINTDRFRASARTARVEFHFIVSI